MYVNCLTWRCFIPTCRGASPQGMAILVTGRGEGSYYIIMVTVYPGRDVYYCFVLRDVEIVNSHDNVRNIY